MIDAAILRDDPARLEAGLRRRGVDIDVDALVALDAKRRELQTKSEELRAQQKRLGKDIPTLDGSARDEAISQASALGRESKEHALEAEAVSAEFDRIWATVPNLPDESAADGLTEDDAVEIKRWGDPGPFSFEPQDHLKIGESLGIIDMQRAAQVSGSRFDYLLGAGVFLEFALVRWALDELASKGFVPVVPPVLVREEALFGTGFFPGDRDQVYAIERDDLFLVGTSEVSLAAMHTGEIFEADQLPTRYVGFSTCFRREAGTYGKDTKGIFRVHQFDKVEMFAFVEPDESRAEHERLLALEEGLVQSLGIPYRVVNIAAGDLGASASKKYDIEAWIPSQQAYREITSCSNTTDFQSRRLRIRYRKDRTNKLVHTLNGTAIAVGRTLLAIMENYQREDGSFDVPEVLHSYAGMKRVERP